MEETNRIPPYTPQFNPRLWLIHYAKSHAFTKKELLTMADVQRTFIQAFSLYTRCTARSDG